MSDTVLSVEVLQPLVQLVRMPVERPGPAVDFLQARSEGVMDLIAHFWERLSQTPPLGRGDLHLVAAMLAEADSGAVNISQLEHSKFLGAMLYVPKAHRADVLALDPATAAAFAAYIIQQGPKAIRSYNDSASTPDSAEVSNPTVPTNAAAVVGPGPDIPGQSITANGITLIPLTDLSSSTRGNAVITAIRSDSAKTSGTANGAKVPIDFLTGHADGIGWMTPLLLSAVNRRVPARRMVNVVMRLPDGADCQPDANIRVARDADVPLLNRWRRQYKEERGILFDADLDAWVQTQRVFVYEHEKQVVAVAKFDLELPRLIEIGGVYTFPEYRTRGFGGKIVSDLACRIRQTGKTPVLQVDEENAGPLRLYTAMGWSSMGRLARVWLTG